MLIPTAVTVKAAALPLPMQSESQRSHPSCDFRSGVAMPVLEVEVPA
jgi:hypothetical protein